MAHIPENPSRLRVVIEAEIEITDREALLAAALAWNDDLYADSTTKAVTQLLRLRDDAPGLRVVGSNVLPRAVEGDEYIEMTLLSMPIQ